MPWVSPRYKETSTYQTTCETDRSDSNPSLIRIAQALIVFTEPNTCKGLATKQLLAVS